MNIHEMIFRFNEIVANSTYFLNNSQKQVDTATILHYLNEAQKIVFKQRYLSQGLNSLRVIDNNLNDLSTLLETKQLTFYSSTHYNKGRIVLFPENTAFPIKLIAEVSRNISSPVTEKIPCNLINYQIIDRYLITSYNSPIILRPVFVLQTDDAGVNFGFYILNIKWQDHVLSQTDTPEYSINTIFNFNWTNYIDYVIEESDIIQPVYEFNWNNFIDVAIEDIQILTKTLDFNWNNFVYLQVEDSEQIEKSVFYKWDSYVDVETNENYAQNELIKLNNIWDNYIYVEQENSLQSFIKFNWNEFVNIETEILSNEFYTFNWINLIDQEIEEEYKKIDFYWHNYIETQLENLISSDYTFNWVSYVESEQWRLNIYNYNWANFVNVEIEVNEDILDPYLPN